MANEEESRKTDQGPGAADSRPSAQGATGGGAGGGTGTGGAPAARQAGQGARSGSSRPRASGAKPGGGSKGAASGSGASRKSSTGGSRSGGSSTGKSSTSRSEGKRPAARAKKPAAESQAAKEGLEIRTRVKETWETVSGTAEAAVRNTARTTRRTASILGLRFRKAARRHTLQEIYRALGQLYYEAAKAGKGSGEPESRVRNLTGEADRVHREIAELERREAEARRR